MIRPLTGIAVSFLLVLVAVPSRAEAGRTVVLLLFDGFSPAYVSAFETPTLDRMRAEGAWSHGMDPAFPTISLINGVTISTGCWPARHGIVTNLFLDPERGLYDHSSDADWLTGCEHLHQAAERQGVRAAALGWYGYRSSTRGALASVVPDEHSFEDFPEDDGRAEQVVEQIARPPGERPRLILGYFKGPDGAGHFTGMDSPETRAAVERSDAIVGRVLDAAAAQPDAGSITVLVTTDHGMVPVRQVVNIARILRRHDIPARPVSTGTTSFLYFDDDDSAVVREALGRLSDYDEFQVFHREAQPEGWNLGTSPRVGDLIVSARPPYFIEDIERWPWFLRFLRYVGPDFLDSSGSLEATHGYPTGTPGVEGVLYAWGSGIAPGREVDRVRAIDVHPTVMHLLGIAPGEPVDGRVEGDLLAEPQAAASGL